MQKKDLRLPDPLLKSNISIEETLNKRRSIRKYNDSPITLNELSQILWSAQGITTKDGRRTSPSAGATYPLEIYIVTRKVEGLSKGIYRYLPERHSVLLLKEGEYVVPVSKTTFQSEMCSNSAALIVISAVVEKTISVYGERGLRYIYMEAGHSAQNISLQGVSIGIGSVLVGAFDDKKLIDALQLKSGEIPLYIIPIGKTELYNK